ncbi:DUF4266 domain-containing protein [Paraglaciecola aquimarina]|uniref:DUF4266 domain-containing protein n=1 Tax=Paraglaciecola aquimarina TaxID=1235557 RepID=A0ABU3SU51_9ALTE|nr:DUF4266 domain-containing protein [Paraglaciecola aquimarina]MDU0353487.1 DUF4266 domain-containing protein [Paraglaciecola aquimarina]
MAHKLVKVVALLLTLQLAGCTNLGVKPWERDILAKKEMALDSEGNDLGLDDHIYFSKEATSGGRAFGGGGCGCN